MKKLADEIVRGDAPERAFALLEKASRSKDYWERYYSIVFLGEVAQSTQRFRAGSVEILLENLPKSDQPTQRAIISAVRDIGPQAVDLALPHLVAFVRTKQEKDVAWFSAQAIGRVKDDSNAQLAIDTLIEGLDCTPPHGYPKDAPQLRRYCLDSLRQVAAWKPELVRARLSARTPGNDSSFEDEIRKLATP